LSPVAVAADRPLTIYRTRALGTGAELVVTDPGAQVPAARILHEELDRIDRLASRFRDDSEIARLHRAAGRQVRVSDDLLDTVLVALRAAEATDGAVDPTVGRAMERLGYDRDFALVAAGVPGRLPPAHGVPGWRTVAVDVGAATIRIPEGVVLDLGATAKALTADRVAARVGRECGCGALVSLGGDVAVSGAPPGGFAVGLGDDWRVIDDGAGSVAVTDGGLATSGLAVRRWRLGADEVHHIVDPATGRPAVPVWRTVTVAAASCVDANTASTAAMVKGAGAVPWLRARALPARLVTTGGEVITVAPWPDGDPPAPGRP
jgi:thiamine biosynthesis lipoprotein